MFTKIPFWILFIDTPAESGGVEASVDEPKTAEQNEAEAAAVKKADALREPDRESAKDFSKALNKRVSEIEAKYADYDELKANAQTLAERMASSVSSLPPAGKRSRHIVSEPVSARQKMADAYNMEATLPGVAFRDVNEAYTESTGFFALAR
ncbi:hypothetical protein [Alloscardovia macacae]|uniref:Uncharacterized protein n=1 Tax=Alloscardovia macacae TaxID=1160091 RepID=A0A261F4R5_9BIFI|nr:hypothetical protein [Alloscardovia macacae]OZG54139.1 hypothetical protein ALMA_0600 [Alloscardovia macacae]